MDTTSSKKIFKWTGIAVFLITAIVFYFSVERTGSLWDCGEFIAGAAKLEVVHPPGAPLFLLIGRMFTVVAEVVELALESPFERRACAVLDLADLDRWFVRCRPFFWRSSFWFNT